MASDPPSVDRTGGAESHSDDENDGRFSREFSEAEKIGEGHFSKVFRARNNVDRQHYAVKRMKQIGRGKAKRQMQESYVLACMALEDDGCPHVVRYFSSWFEGSQLFIQMELCQGSLRDHLESLSKERHDPRCTEAEIVDILRQVTSGLHSMHECGFAHLDIKPDNVMRGRGSGRWKIGDLGLAVAAMNSGVDEVCEGDCRYLAREVLQGDLTDLEKADVFSLGCMTYEMATNPSPLPGDGPAWQALRDGVLESTLLVELSAGVHALLRSLLRPLAAERPSCEELLDECRRLTAKPGPVLLGNLRPPADAEVQQLRKERDDFRHCYEASQREVAKLKAEAQAQAAAAAVANAQQSDLVACGDALGTGVMRESHSI